MKWLSPCFGVSFSQSVTLMSASDASASGNQNPWNNREILPEMVSVKYSTMSVADLKKEMKDRRGIRS